MCRTNYVSRLNDRTIEYLRCVDTIFHGIKLDIGKWHPPIRKTRFNMMGQECTGPEPVLNRFIDALQYD